MVGCMGEHCEIELKDHGLVHVVLHDGCLNVDSKQYTMLVPTDYWEPYRHVLGRMTNRTLSEMPFQRGIVQMDPYYKVAPPPPRYLKASTTYNLQCLAAGEDDEKLSSLMYVGVRDKSWPDEKKMKVNAKQLQALKLALTTELALIQV